MNDVIAKSIIFETLIGPALDGSGEVPEPWEDWRQDFIEYADEAKTAATQAGIASTQAVNAATSAAQSSDDAANSATAAETAQVNAEDAADRAEEAAGSIGDLAEDAEAWAVGQRGGVDVPDTDPAYENNAKYYAEQAGLSESSAETSANIASTQAGNATTAANTASGKADEAARSASEARVSAENAASSADDAADSARAASESENTASTAAQTATTQAGNATTASQTATQKAASASQSATAAAASEANAKTSETNAATSETNAATSADDAADSALEAKGYRDELVGELNGVAQEDTAQTLLTETRGIATGLQTLIEVQRSIRWYDELPAVGTDGYVYITSDGIYYYDNGEYTQVSGGGDLNGFSLSKDASDRVVLTYTNPDDETDTDSAVMATATTGDAIADELKTINASLKTMIPTGA